MAENRRKDVDYSVRLFPVSLDIADILMDKLLYLRPIKRQMRDPTDWNVIVSIDENHDTVRLADFIETEDMISKCDIFISIVPEEDSIIREVPVAIVNLIQRLGCRVVISYTTGF